MISAIASNTKLSQRFNLRGLTLDALRGPVERGLEFDVRLEKLYHWQHTSRMVILAMTFIGPVLCLGVICCQLTSSDQARCALGRVCACMCMLHVARVLTLVYRKNQHFCRPCAIRTCTFPGYQASGFSRIMYTWADLVSRAKIESRSGCRYLIEAGMQRSAIIETLSSLQSR